MDNFEDVKTYIKEIKWNKAYTSYTLKQVISDMEFYYNIPSFTHTLTINHHPTRSHAQMNNSCNLDHKLVQLNFAERLNRRCAKPPFYLHIYNLDDALY